MVSPGQKVTVTFFNTNFLLQNLFIYLFIHSSSRCPHSWVLFGHWVIQICSGPGKIEALSLRFYHQHFHAQPTCFIFILAWRIRDLRLSHTPVPRVPNTSLHASKSLHASICSVCRPFFNLHVLYLSDTNCLLGRQFKELVSGSFHTQGELTRLVYGSIQMSRGPLSVMTFERISRWRLALVLVERPSWSWPPILCWTSMYS